MSRRVITSLLVCCALLAAAASAAQAATPISHTVTVAKVGNGYVSGSGGIDCGSACSATLTGPCAYDAELGTNLCDFPVATLQAASANGFLFDHWDGCDGTPTYPVCSKELFDDSTVTAHFWDVQPPSVTLTSPTAGTVRNGVLSIAATAADNDAVTRVDFSVRGVKVASDSTAPYAASFDTTTVADGAATVEARAYDSTGNSAAASAGITIDNSVSTVTAPVASAAPLISGTAVVGSVLTNSKGTWSGSPTKYTYSWQRCDAAGNACAAIGTRDATNDNAYTPVKADAGHALRVVVTATNSAGSGTSTSAATAAVTSPPRHK